MGCDIHFFVEVFRDGEWELAPGQVKPCARCQGNGLDPEEITCRNCEKYQDAHAPEEGKCLFDSTQWDPEYHRCLDHCLHGKQLYPTFYSGRNYELFGILSGVRGDYDESFTIEDRGFPPDVSPLLREYGSSSDLHSHGYYTLAEFGQRSWKGDLAYFAKTLKEMAKLSSNPEHVRAVFCYDN